MAYASKEELKDEIFTELYTELKREPLFNPDILRIKISDAVREVERRRCYKNTAMSEKEILDDLESLYSVIKKAALVYYNRIGSEGELVHYENTVHRSYTYEDDIFRGVIPFVKVIA